MSGTVCDRAITPSTAPPPLFDIYGAGRYGRLSAKLRHFVASCGGSGRCRKHDDGAGPPVK